MRSGFLVAAFVVALCLVACGGGGSNGNGLPPGVFEEQREALALRLESIGVNIGAVPDDVRRALLRDCQSLGRGADEGNVADICDAVDEAIDRGDPALIDRLVGRLRDLEGD